MKSLLTTFATAIIASTLTLATPSPPEALKQTTAHISLYNYKNTRAPTGVSSANFEVADQRCYNVQDLPGSMFIEGNLGAAWFRPAKSIGYICTIWTQRNCKGSNADVKPSPKEPDSKGYWYPDENPLWATADVRNLSLMCRK